MLDSVRIEDLLKIILFLVIIWLVEEIIGARLENVVDQLQPLVGLIVAILIAVWIVDRL